MAASARSSTDKTAHCAILRINVLREQLFGLGALLALTEVRVLRGRGLVLRRRGPGGGALNLEALACWACLTNEILGSAAGRGHGLSPEGLLKRWGDCGSSPP